MRRFKKSCVRLASLLETSIKDPQKNLGNEKTSSKFKPTILRSTNKSYVSCHSPKPFLWDLWFSNLWRSFISKTKTRNSRPKLSKCVLFEFTLLQIENTLIEQLHASY